MKRKRVIDEFYDPLRRLVLRVLGREPGGTPDRARS